MNKFIKYFILAWIGLVSLKIHAESNNHQFQYESTELITHFLPTGQVYSGRSRDAYDPNHVFSQIYDIVIKYAYSMQAINNSDSNININFAIWHEMHFINKDNSQVLFVGDHILTDGNSWTLLNEQDYLKLKQVLLELNNRDKQPLTKDKKKLVSDWVYSLALTSNGDNYENHFRKIEEAKNQSYENHIPAANQNDSLRGNEVPLPTTTNKSSEISTTSSTSSTHSSSISSAHSSFNSSQSYKSDSHINDNSFKNDFESKNKLTKTENKIPITQPKSSHSILMWLALLGIVSIIILIYKRR